jgi:hypothetical protein
MASIGVDWTENTDCSYSEPLVRCERKPEIIARRLEIDQSSVGGVRTVLLNGDTGACFELNAVGTAIWDTLDGSRTWADISAELVRQFALAPADAAIDVKKLADALCAAKLIRPARP